MARQSVPWAASVVVVAAISASQAMAAVYWVGDLSNSWDDAGNWVPGVPGRTATLGFKNAGYTNSLSTGTVSRTVQSIGMEAASGAAAIHADSGGKLVLGGGPVDVAAGSGGLTITAPLQTFGLTKSGGGLLNVGGDTGGVTGTINVTAGALQFSAMLLEGHLQNWDVTTPNPGAPFTVGGINFGGLQLTTRIANSGSNTPNNAIPQEAGWTHVYTGRFYVPLDNTTYSFAECFDDNVFLKVDNTTLLNDVTWNNCTQASITLSQGWHDIDVRVFDGGGGWGPMQFNSNGINWTATDLGVGYDPTGATVTSSAQLLPITASAVRTLGPVQMSNNSVLRMGGGNFITTPSVTADAGCQVEMSSASLTVSDGQSKVFAGAITGMGSLVKTGAGAWILSGASTYTGPTAVVSGTLQLVGGNDRLPVGTEFVLGSATTGSSGRLVLGDATGAVRQTLASLTALGDGLDNRVVGGNAGADSVLALNVADGKSITMSAILGGPGVNENRLAFVKAGPGTALLTQPNTHTGGTAINGGVLQVGGDANLGSPGGALSLDGGTLQTVNAGLTTTRTVTLNAGGGTINTNGFDSTFSGLIGGSGALRKNGPGKLFLSGPNNYAGATTINAGTLQFSSHASVGGTGASVKVNGYGATAAAGFPIDNSFLARILPASPGGAVALAVDSGQPLNFAAAGLSYLSLGAVGSATYSGTLTPAGSSYRLGGGGGRLTYAGPLKGAYVVNIVGPGTVVFPTITDNSKDYSQTTNLADGTLEVQSGAWGTSMFTTLTFAGGTLRWDVDNNDDLSQKFNLVDPGVMVNIEVLQRDPGAEHNVVLSQRPLTDRHGATVAGAAGLRKLGPGTLTLKTASTTSPPDYMLGTTRIVAGKLRIADSAGLALQGTTLDLNAADSGTLVFAGSAGGATPVTSATFVALQGSRNLSLKNEDGNRVTLNVLLPTNYPNPPTNTTFTYSGILDDLGAPTSTLDSLSVSVQSTNTLLLSGPNAYRGKTTIQSGTLKVQPGTTALPSVSSVSVVAGAILDVTDTQQTIGGLGGAGRVTLDSAATVLTIDTDSLDNTTTKNRFSGVIGGVTGGLGGLVKSGTGILALYNGSAAWLSGEVRPAAGTLRLGGPTGGRVRCPSRQKC
jgi:autotransporter-associated beta strand protein